MSARSCRAPPTRPQAPAPRTPRAAAAAVAHTSSSKVTRARSALAVTRSPRGPLAGPARRMRGRGGAHEAPRAVLSGVNRCTAGWVFGRRGPRRGPPGLRIAIRDRRAACRIKKGGGAPGVGGVGLVRARPAPHGAQPPAGGSAAGRGSSPRIRRVWAPRGTKINKTRRSKTRKKCRCCEPILDQTRGPCGRYAAVVGALPAAPAYAPWRGGYGDRIASGKSQRP